MSEPIDFKTKLKEKVKKETIKPVDILSSIIPKQPIISHEKNSWTELMSTIGKNIEENKITDFICIYTLSESTDITYHWFGTTLKCTGMLGLCELMKNEILNYMDKVK